MWRRCDRSRILVASLLCILRCDSASILLRHPNSHNGPINPQRRQQQQQQDERKLSHVVGHDDGEEETVKQTKIRSYKLWEPDEIAQTVERWAEHYPDLIRVTTSQEKFGLPTAGGSEDCPFDKSNVGCSNHILYIQDYETHPEGSESSNMLPEVLWSGEVHGNERVGPTAVLEAAQLLLDAATCEMLPRMELKYADPDAFTKEIEKAKSCRMELLESGIDDDHRKWLARLVSTRRIVIIPTANALGYYQIKREENGIDPNRDFPYDVIDPTDCMQTIAGRTLNEVFRTHMFQLSLTFHGGMEVIGYEWGAPTWGSNKSPDDNAQSIISKAYSQFAGGWSTTKPYDYGPMNDLVYPVRGGMEDWAYAGSWDPERVIQCQPRTYDGYDAEKTTYDESTLRVFNMLVETSNSKIPSESDLGTSEEIMTNSIVGNGHVARNIRLALLAAELVEPYVHIQTVNEYQLQDDIIPMTDRTCTRVLVPHNSMKTVLRWTVGGAIDVDETFLYYAKWDDRLESLLDCSGQQPADEGTLLPLFTEAKHIGAPGGTTQFASKGATPNFSATMDISGFQKGDKIAVIARAQVDQSWGEKKEDAAPDLPPQSHLANARTNPDWRHEQASTGKVIQGRLFWYSRPITIELMEFKDNDKGEAHVETEEAELRYDESLLPTSPRYDYSNGGKNDSNSTTSEELPIVLISVCAVAALTLLAGGTYLNRSMRKTRRERLREFIEDENAVSPGLQKIAAIQDQQQGSRRKNGYSDVETNNGDDQGGVEMGRFN